MAALYILGVAILAALLAIQAWQEYFGGDVYAHLSVLRALSANPLNPLNPFVSSNDPSMLFSPYTVGLGIVGWASGADSIYLLHIGAALNLVLFTVGLWAFSRSFSKNPWAPHLTLFLSLLAWGVNSWRWSGFIGLNSIGFGLGYPSTFATAISLLTLAGICRYFSTRRLWVIVAVAVGMATIGLTHQFVALWFGIAAIAIVVVQPPPALRATAPALIGGAALTIVLALIWPYYSVLALVQATGGTLQAQTSAAIEMYRQVPLRGFLLIPGSAAVIVRSRQGVKDPLLWMFVGGLTVYALGLLSGSYGLGRVLPLIALSGHVALADLLAGWLASDTPRQTRYAWASIAAVGAIGLVGSSSGVARMVPRALLPAAIAERLEPSIEPYAALRDVIGPSDVVFASPSMSRVLPAVTGKVVLPAWITPLLGDRTARERDSVAFFSIDTTDTERIALASRWGAAFIAVVPEDMGEYPWLLRSYDVLIQTDAFVVFSLK